MNKTKHANTLVWLYIFLMPFTSAFSVTKVLPLPLLFLTVITIGLLLTGRFTFIRCTKADAILLAIVLLGIVPWAFLTPELGGTNIGHLVGISASILLYYVCVRSMLLSQANFSWEKFANTSRNALLFISLVIIIECFSASFLHVYISDIVPFPGAEELGRPDLLFGLKRPRAFSAEAGFTALYFEMLAPIAWLLGGKNHTNHLVWLVIACAYCVLASAASFFALSASLLIAFLLFRDKKKIILVVLFIMVSISTYYFVDIVQYYFDNTMLRKFTMLVDNDFTYSSGRRYIYHTSLMIIKDYPIGIGWGTLSQEFRGNGNLLGNVFLVGGGAISLFLEIGVAAGWIGLSAFLGFVVSKISMLFRMRGRVRYKAPELIAVFISLLAVSLHHIFISQFYFPFFWFSLALADFTYHSSKNSRTATC